MYNIAKCGNEALTLCMRRMFSARTVGEKVLLKPAVHTSIDILAAADAAPICLLCRVAMLKAGCIELLLSLLGASPQALKQQHPKVAAHITGALLNLVCGDVDSPAAKHLFVKAGGMDTGCKVGHPPAVLLLGEGRQWWQQAVSGERRRQLTSVERLHVVGVGGTIVVVSSGVTSVQHVRCCSCKSCRCWLPGAATTTPPPPCGCACC